jgi:hypothetical protein
VVARWHSVIDDESLVVCSVRGEDLQRGEMKGEVRHTVNQVHGTWGGGSPRKGSTMVFPRYSDEAGGSPTDGFGQEARRHGGCHAASWHQRKAEGGEKRRWPFYRGTVGSRGKGGGG